MQSANLSERAHSEREHSRLDRSRAARLDRTLSRAGFVRTHTVTLTAAGIEATATLPRYYLRQSLAPVLSARGLRFEIRDARAADAESLVVARIVEDDHRAEHI